jgi:succinate dehydrogenase hydrophobic anchor subunit
MRSEDYKVSSVQKIGGSFERIGFIGWFGLYVTGALLLIFVLTHIWLIHYTAPQPITLKHITEALSSPLVIMVDLGLLLLAVIHGMIGLGKLILDLELIQKSGARVLNVILFLLGMAIFIAGIYVFKFFCFPVPFV